MRQLTKNLYFFALFTVLVLASLFGAVVPVNKPQLSIGPMQIAPFRNGLSLYQGYRGSYYTISPFNDYAVFKDGTRSTFITSEEIENKTYRASDQSHWRAILSTLKGYLKPTKSSISFYAKNDIFYLAEATDANQVLVKRKLTSLASENWTKIATTLTYSDQSFVFDDQGNLYTYQLDQEIKFFEENYGVRLVNKVADLRIKVPSKTLFILDPKISGVIVIETSNNQALWVNKEDNLIEIEEAVSPGKQAYETQIKIKVYPSLEDIPA